MTSPRVDSDESRMVPRERILRIRGVRDLDFGGFRGKLSEAMKWIRIGALVVGCTPQSEVHDAAPTPPPPDAAALDPEQQRDLLRSLPASAGAGMQSPPRDQWACAFEVDEDQGLVAHGRGVFAYGERTSCRIPHTMVINGVHGCPASYERTDTDGLVRTRTFDYDAEGRMVTFHGNVTEHYAWDGDRLVSTTREQFGVADVATYRDHGEQIIAVDAEGREQQVLVFADGRLVEMTEFLNGHRGATASVQWADGRPNGIEIAVHGPIRGSVKRRLVYDCPAPPARVDPALVVPEPDAKLAAMPVDVRLADWTAVLEHHRRDCKAFRARPCELVADFDGDGKKDRAVKIREKSSRRAGIAIRWASGGVSIVGAGVATRQLSTDVYLDGVDLSWSAVEDDFDFLLLWSIVARSGTGFAGAGPKLPRSRTPTESPAPAATGAGILLDGGDAAEVLYWDGTQWRRLILGF